MNKEIHEVQASILRELLFNNGTNFAALNKLGLSNDHFTFHIKHLIKEEIIEKRGKLYFLTQNGKQMAGRLDIDALKIEKFGTPGVAVTAIKNIRGVTHYLIQQRLKEPLYGYFGFINGKIRFSEFSQETAERELFEETGLRGKPEFVAIHHRLRGPSRDQVKLDHFFFIYLIKNPKGTLKHTKEGRNYWKTIEEIRKLKTFPGFDSSLKAVVDGVTSYEERFIQVDEI